MTDHDQIAAWLGGRLQPVDKLEVHRSGLRHPAVSVFVRVEGRFLWQQRAADKYHSGLLWANTCCTHPLWGEPPEVCANRRLAEELGMDAQVLTPLGQVEYRAEVGAGMVEHEVVDVFLATPRQPPVLRLNPDEVAATRWQSLTEVDAAIAAHPAQFTPWLKLYLTDHRAALFGSGGQTVDSRPGSVV
jgi:isopentenyl-diphosphate Delta-isomerase